MIMIADRYTSCHAIATALIKNHHRQLIWFDLVWFGLVWFDLVWFDLIWFDSSLTSLTFSFLETIQLCVNTWCAIHPRIRPSLRQWNKDPIKACVSCGSTNTRNELRTMVKHRWLLSWDCSVEWPPVVFQRSETIHLTSSRQVLFSNIYVYIYIHTYIHTYIICICLFFVNCVVLGVGCDRYERWTGGLFLWMLWYSESVQLVVLGTKRNTKTASRSLFISNVGYRGCRILFGFVADCLVLPTYRHIVTSTNTYIYILLP